MVQVILLPLKQSTAAYCVPNLRTWLTKIRSFPFYAPNHKMSGALCHGLWVGIRKHLVSVNYRTNALVDWSDFSVAQWRWLEEGFFRWSAPPLIQDGHYDRHLWFGFRRLDNKHLWHIGGDYRKVPCDDQLHRSSKMATMATILDLVSVAFLTNTWVDWSDFLVAHWGWLEESSFRWSGPPLI
jgi:hypothetical protein